MYENIKYIEAREQMKHLNMLGALLGGENGTEYIEMLIDTVYEEDEHKRENAKHALAASNAKRGDFMAPPPDHAPEGF